MVESTLTGSFDAIDHPSAELAGKFLSRIRTRAQCPFDIPEIVVSCLQPIFKVGTATPNDPIVRRLVIVINRNKWHELRSQVFGHAEQIMLRQWIYARLPVVIRINIKPRQFHALAQSCELLAMLFLQPEDVELLPAPSIASIQVA
ncbi:MAG: hypothetical protein Q8P30_01925 [Candidatus Uhrbacteria bacterium]|nr:hypothetical protein [Candidatus Uhrbacteria bacterium]